MGTVIFEAGLTREIQARSCDQCYAKKSKCSRHVPCQTCASAQVPCSYRRRTHYQRKEKLDQRRRQTRGQSVPLPTEDVEQQIPTSLPTVERVPHVPDWPEIAGENSTPSLESILADTPEPLMPDAIWDIDAATAPAGRASTSRQPEPRTAPSDQNTGLWSLDTSWDQLFAPFGHPFPPEISCAVVIPEPRPQPAAISYLPAAVNNENTLQALTDIFLDRLHPSMPFFKRAYLLDHLRLRQHEADPAFGALLHALCALTLLQPVQGTDRDVYPDREQQAETLLARAVRLHSSIDLGEKPTLENILTSIFLFACQFCRGNHNAARFRLREAVTLAEIMKLGDVQGYCGLSPDERDRSLRTVLCLTVLERVYAIQRAYPFEESSLVGSRIHTIRDMLKQSCRTADHDARDLRAISALGDMVESFEFVDNKLLRCWRNECWRPNGRDGASPERHVSPAAVCALLRRYTAPVPVSGVGSSDTQRADILITRHWIRSVLWNLALRHGFVSESSHDGELRPEYAVSVAVDAIDTCDAFSMRVLEMHGIGLTEKLRDIAVTAIRVVEERENGSLPRCPETPGLGHRLSAPHRPPECEVSSPPDDGNSELAVSEQSGSYLRLFNRYLALFATFRGGQHPFLKPYVQRLYELNLFVV